MTVEGRPLQGLGLAVVDLKSGEIHRTKSDAKGNYRLRVQPGEYVVTSLSLAGLGVGRGPARVVVEAGRVVVASLELIRLPVAFPAQPQPPAQTPPAPGPQTSVNITYDPYGCFVAGQLALIRATIEPHASIARARVYFKSDLSPAIYYVEMTLQDATASLIGGTKVASSQISGAMLAAPQERPKEWVTKLPRVQLKAVAVTHWLFAINTEGVESQTQEYRALVVADESECPEGVRVAPFGPPGAVTVFSATSGIATTALLGFGGAGLGAVALGAIVLGVVGGGLGIREATRDEAAPPASAPPSTTATTTSTTTTTTTTTVPSRACEYALANCTFDPVSELPNNCPCIAVGERCATRVVGQPCPIDLPNDKVTECCSRSTTCSQIGQPTLPAPSNPPCDTSLPPVFVSK